jgi:dihydrofolate reductase
MIYTIIVAVDLKGGISKDGNIPWHYREDFEWFKEKTAFKHCLMGRGTYEDIARRGNNGKHSITLEARDTWNGRTPWIVSSTLLGEGVLRTPMEIEKRVPEHTEVMVLGGVGLYTQLLPFASIVHLTLIKKDYQCDQLFPTELVYNNFDLVYNDSNRHPDLQFSTYIRKVSSL